MYKITHNKSKLSKLVNWDDFSIGDIAVIYEFYSNNEDYSIDVVEV